MNHDNLKQKNNSVVCSLNVLEATFCVKVEKKTSN